MDGKRLRWEQLSLKKLFQIQNGIWTGNQRTFMGWRSLENSLEKRGTLDFQEIWPASSLVHFIAKKIHFYQKRLKILNSTRKGNSDWFHDSLNPKLYFWIPLFDLGS
jgi:hypothetical protein